MSDVAASHHEVPDDRTQGEMSDNQMVEYESMSLDPTVYRSQLNSVRAYRRLKESEEQKLANRIQLLQQELEKSKRKIKETKTRADVILTHRRELEEKNARLAEQHKLQEEKKRAILEQRRKEREHLAAKKQLITQKTFAEKREEARQMKEEKKLHREEILQRKSKDKKHASTVCAVIKKHQFRWKEKQEELSVSTMYVERMKKGVRWAVRNEWREEVGSGVVLFTVSVSLIPIPN